MSNSAPTTPIATILRGYIDDGAKVSGHDSLYKLFEDSLSNWRLGDWYVLQCCETLILEHKAILDAPRSAKKSGSQESPKPTDPSKPLDTLERTPRNSLVSAQELSTLATPPPSRPSYPQSSKRKLSAADCEYILAEIRSNLDYWKEQKRLDASLCQPITKEEFATTVSSISSKHDGDDTWDTTLNTIVERFKERWLQAPVSEVETKTASGIQFEKNK
jgi:hypothetical protein